MKHKTKRNQNSSKRSLFAFAIFFLGWASLYSVQQAESNKIKAECGGSLYVSKTDQTAVGPVESCTSAVQLHGPSIPLKD